MSDPTNPYKAPASTEAPASSATAGTATPKTRELLGQAAPWLRFLTVLGYIGLAVIVIVAVVLFFVGGSMGGAAAPWLGFVLGLVYLALGLVFYFPLRIQGRLTKGAKRYKIQGDAADLEAVAAGVKGLAKFYGILAIVLVALYLVIIVGAIALAPLLAQSFIQQ
jgi:hypothetical protein